MERHFHITLTNVCFQMIQAYLELRVRSQKTRVFRHLVQLGVLVWGVWVSCTRIHDFKHRYSDVAGGMVIGVSVAFFAVSVLCDIEVNVKISNLKQCIYISVFRGIINL